MSNTTMIQMSQSQPAGFGMPWMSSSVRDRVACVRVLPMTTGVVSDATAGKTAPVVTGIEGTRVCGYRHIAGADAVLTGAFPGTSAWSPPI